MRVTLGHLAWTASSKATISWLSWCFHPKASAAEPPARTTASSRAKRTTAWSVIEVTSSPSIASTFGRFLPVVTTHRWMKGLAGVPSNRVMEVTSTAIATAVEPDARAALHLRTALNPRSHRSTTPTCVTQSGSLTILWTRCPFSYVGLPVLLFVVENGPKIGSNRN